MMLLMKGGTVTSIVEKDDALGLALTAWASELLKVKTEFTDSFFPSFDGSLAPIYFYPINFNTVSSSNGLITNGFGFAQQ